MKKEQLEELSILRQKAILAVKEYNLVARSQLNEMRLLLSDCNVDDSLGGFPYGKEYTRHHEPIMENDVIIRDWSSSTQSCEGYGNDEGWNDSGCSI